MFITALLCVSVYAESGKKESSSKVPLDKKLDKRGLLNLGYGYGIHGLDLGYLGDHGHLGSLHHTDSSLNGLHGYGHGGLVHGYGGGLLHGHEHSGFLHGHGPILHGHTDVVKTITQTVGVPVPVVHEKHIPVIHEKQVAVPVRVPVPQPYPVVKHVPGTSCFFFCILSYIFMDYARYFYPLKKL